MAAIVSSALKSTTLRVLRSDHLQERGAVERCNRDAPRPAPGAQPQKFPAPVPSMASLDCTPRAGEAVAWHGKRTGDAKMSDSILLSTWFTCRLKLKLTGDTRCARNSCSGSPNHTAISMWLGQGSPSR